MCFDGGTVHCGDSITWCYQGSVEDTADLCRGISEVGPCSTEGAVGFCTMTDYGWEITYYDIRAGGNAMDRCAEVGGTWTPA